MSPCHHVSKSIFVSSSTSSICAYLNFPNHSITRRFWPTLKRFADAKNVLANYALKIDGLL
jgi:hypothetical protein